MRRLLTTTAVVGSLLLLSIGVPAVSSAAPTAPAARTAQALNPSVSQTTYVTYCLKAINDDIADQNIDTILEEELHLTKVAKVYDIVTSAPDVGELVYESQNGQLLNVPL